MTREENLHWIDQEIQTWENECQSKHPIKEALCAARKALEQEPCEDAVSRAEVIKIAKEMYLEVANMELDVKTISDCISYTASKCREVLERRLQALSSVTPQEPMVEIDLYSVIKQKYIEREVLDKIRTEIESIDLLAEYTRGDIKRMALATIDKYKAESEGV